MSDAEAVSAPLKCTFNEDKLQDMHTYTYIFVNILELGKVVDKSQKVKSANQFLPGT